MCALLTRAAGWSVASVCDRRGALVAGLALERLAAGISAARRFRTLTPLVFPLLHLGRDLAWVAAIAMWLARRVVRPAVESRAQHAAEGGRCTAPSAIWQSLRRAPGADRPAQPEQLGGHSDDSPFSLGRTCP